MPKKSVPRYQPPPEVETAVVEIVSVQNRGWQPFIKAFQYEPENVGQSGLGTLFGIFIIDHYSYQSQYIVNFLVSALKKAYYANQKRSPVEALEGALHRVNLGLAELVKQNNTDWLGHFHAIVGVTERHELHFSAAGQAKLFLLRRDCLTEISEGLASEEAVEHPLKTFTDISSGRLEAEDCLVATTPALLEIVTPLELERVFRRLPPDQFRQFLRTVIDNKVEFGGALCLTVREKPTRAERPTPRQAAEAGQNILSADKPANFFGGTIFEQATQAKKKRAKKAEMPEAERLDELEVLDGRKKTKDIFVEGEELRPSERSERWEHLMLLWEDVSADLRRGFRTLTKETGAALASLMASSARFSDRALRHGAAWSGRAGRGLKRSGTRAFRDVLGRLDELQVRLRRPRTPRQETEAFSMTDEELLVSPPETPAIQHAPAPAPRPLPEPTAPEEIKSEVPAWILRRRMQLKQEKTTEGPLRVPVTERAPAIPTAPQSFVKSLAQLLGQVQSVMGTVRARLSRVRPLTLLAAIVLVASIAVIWRYLAREEAPTPVPAAPTPVAETPEDPLTDEPGLVRLTDAPSKRQEGATIALAVVGDTSLAVSADSVRVFPAEGEPKTYSLSATETGRAVMAVAMPAIRTLFILTDRDQILSFTPSNGRFAANTFVLPETSQPVGLGAYLTYLYVLDAATDQIYRYPRAEGGFGQSVSWLKESVALDEKTGMTVGETVILAQGSSLRAFSKGRFDPTVVFENPAHPLSATALAQGPDGTLLVLDQAMGRVLVYSPEGKIVRQYAHEALAQASVVALSGQTLWFGTADGVFALTLPN